MDEFRRRLMFNLSKKEIPSTNYTRCLYIQNPSTAYIDTGVKPSNTLKMEIVLENTEFNPWRMWFGARYKESIGYFIANFASNGYIMYQFGAGLYKTLQINVPNNKMTIVNENGKMTINGIEYDASTPNYSLDYNIYLFGLNKQGSYDGGNLNLRIFSCKLYEGDILVRDFVPVFESSSNTYGMLDNVENKFYTSPNNTPFIGKKL